MLIDEVILQVHAGHGGKGAVAFNKNMKSLGPVGGSGGRGGSIYFEGVADLGALRSFRHKKIFEAEDGADGRGQFRDGHDGKDLILKVPVGTVIHGLSADHEIVSIGERLPAAEGGLGGKGNFHFRSSRNTSPRQFQSGLPGEAKNVRLELKLIADVGFIGLPNAGKSSLLNALTRAGARVANYPFTTLEPNLGVWNDLVLADIPGLIEGASRGKGLGIKFLRHIERTRVLFHLISCEAQDPKVSYNLIRKELGSYQEELLKKEEYILLTKTDLVSQDVAKEQLLALKREGLTAIPLSLHDNESLKSVTKLLEVIDREKHAHTSPLLPHSRNS